MNLDDLLNQLNSHEKNLLFKNNNLNESAGIFWALVWVFILVVLGNKPFWSAITSGFYFFIFWIVISIILILFCEYFKFFI